MPASLQRVSGNLQLYVVGQTRLPCPGNDIHHVTGNAYPDVAVAWVGQWSKSVKQLYQCSLRPCVWHACMVCILYTVAIYTRWFSGLIVADASSLADLKTDLVCRVTSWCHCSDCTAILCSVYLMTIIALMYLCCCINLMSVYVMCSLSFILLKYWSQLSVTDRSQRIAWFCFF